MFRLDTSVVSELRKRDRANDGVRAFIDPIAEDELHLSVLVAGELRQGVERLRMRDSKQAEHLDQWLRKLVDGYGRRLLPVDSRVADTWGSIEPTGPRFHD